MFGIDYYVTIRNDGPVTAAYNIQGRQLDWKQRFQNCGCGSSLSVAGEGAASHSH